MGKCVMCENEPKAEKKYYFGIAIVPQNSIKKSEFHIAYRFMVELD